MRAVANSTDVIAAQQYSPYGVPLDTMTETDFGFTGEMTDDNDLVYLRARYLHPGMGVFAGLDPFEGDAETPLTLNGYGWVEGNTPNRTDPSGTVSVAAGAVGLGVFLAASLIQKSGCSQGSSASSGGVKPIRIAPAKLNPLGTPVSYHIPGIEQDEPGSLGAFAKDGGPSGWGGVIALGLAVAAGAGWVLGQVYSQGIVRPLSSETPDFPDVSTTPPSEWDATSIYDHILFNRRETKNLQGIGAAAGIPEEDLSEFVDYLHKKKKKVPGTKNDRGDYTDEEILEQAEEFLTDPDRSSEFKGRPRPTRKQQGNNW